MKLTPGDFQQATVYTAEDEALVDFSAPDDLEADEVQPYLDRALAALAFSHPRTPGLYFDVVDATELLGFCSPDGVHLLPSHLSRHTTLHELAHWVSRGDGHGPLFCAMFLELVDANLGTAAHDALRDSFDAHGVKVASIAQRDATRDREIADGMAGASLRETLNGALDWLTGQATGAELAASHARLCADAGATATSASVLDDGSLAVTYEMGSSSVEYEYEVPELRELVATGSITDVEEYVAHAFRDLDVSVDDLTSAKST